MSRIGPFELDRVYQGDCLEMMKALPDSSVDLVLTDPPYGHNNNNNGDLISRREAALGRGDYIPARDNRPIVNDGAEEAEALYKSLLLESKRILRTGGAFCCCCGGGGPDPQFARWSLWLDEVIGFTMGVVWDKGGLGMGWHYRRCWEIILVGVKGAPVKWRGGNSVPNIIRDVPKIIPRSEQHPTVKPVELMEFFISNHTDVGDVVFDPFLGSGTTVVAAKRLGRRFLGFELNPDYVKLAERRLANVPRRLEEYL